MTRQLLEKLALPMLAIAAAACGGASEHEGYGAVGTAQQEVYAATDTLWPPDPGAYRTSISVCFRSPGGWATEIGWVRDAVESSWEAATPIDFTGFGDCAAGAADIPITIVDDAERGPHVVGLGTNLRKMSLNFTFDNWNSRCQSRREFCIRAIAIHEFGHAIGLAHEHNRPDRPASCTDEPQGSTGDTFFAYDAQSTMNYCHRYRDELSDLDEQDIQRLYGGADATIHTARPFALRDALGDFLVLRRSRRGAPALAFGSAIGQNNRVGNTLELEFADGRDKTVGYGDAIRLKGSKTDAPYLGTRAGTRGSLSLVAGAATNWTITRPSGSTSAGPLRVNEAFLLSKVVNGTRRYITRSRGSRTQAAKAFLTSSRSRAVEWRLLGPMDDRPLDEVPVAPPPPPPKPLTPYENCHNICGGNDDCWRDVPGCGQFL